MYTYMQRYVCIVCSTRKVPAAAKSGSLAELQRWHETEPAPALSPAIVTRRASPPNAAMLSETHSMAARWSCRSLIYIYGYGYICVYIYVYMCIYIYIARRRQADERSGRERSGLTLKCIFGISRLYFTCIPPVSHRILGTPLYPGVDLYLAILKQIHCIPLYPTESSCIRTYLAVSSCICCVPLYLTVSHRLENGIWPKVYSRGGLKEAITGPGAEYVDQYSMARLE